MNIVTDIKAWCETRKNINAPIGFIPTMGHLHQGHLSLCERSQRENDVTVVSIFINPTQFNEAKDFEHYPRTVEEDLELLNALQIDYVLLPTPSMMYPDHYQIQIQETELSKTLEGEYRPQHFNGMLTIVLKLLNLVQAERAYFGEKDFQQYLLIDKMAQALFLTTDIIACETVRAPDGVALSSRNSRLTTTQRELATHFPRLLNSLLPIDQIRKELETLGFKVDYIAEAWQRRLGAVWLDQVRLIDNIALK